MYTKGFRIEAKYSEDLKKDINYAVLYSIDGHDLETPIQTMYTSFNRDVYGTQFGDKSSSDAEMKIINDVISRFWNMTGNDGNCDWKICEFCIATRLKLSYHNGHVIYQDFDKKYHIIFFRSSTTSKHEVLEEVKRFNDKIKFKEE